MNRNIAFISYLLHWFHVCQYWGIWKFKTTHSFWNFRFVTKLINNKCESLQSQLNIVIGCLRCRTKVQARLLRLSVRIKSTYAAGGSVHILFAKSELQSRRLGLVVNWRWSAESISASKRVSFISAPWHVVLCYRSHTALKAHVIPADVTF